MVFCSPASVKEQKDKHSVIWWFSLYAYYCLRFIFVLSFFCAVLADFFSHYIFDYATLSCLHLPEFKTIPNTLFLFVGHFHLFSSSSYLFFFYFSHHLLFLLFIYFHTWTAYIDSLAVQLLTELYLVIRN